jgi:outer membrane lipoprotein SlyB
MKKMLVVTVLATALTPLGALAQERVGDAALGALSGAVVLGPVGAVAGAVVGYTAGPAIASSWGLRRYGRRHYRRSARR